MPRLIDSAMIREEASVDGERVWFEIDLALTELIAVEQRVDNKLLTTLTGTESDRRKSECRERLVVGFDGVIKE